MFLCRDPGHTQDKKLFLYHCYIIKQLSSVDIILKITWLHQRPLQILHCALIGKFWNLNDITYNIILRKCTKICVYDDFSSVKSNLPLSSLNFNGFVPKFQLYCTDILLCFWVYFAWVLLLIFLMLIFTTYNLAFCPNLVRGSMLLQIW